MHAENPFCVIITGDFNCRSTQWRKNDVENNEGKLFGPITSYNSVHQLTSEPMHLMGDSKSCIDLIFTDQPHLIIEYGACPSLHEQCNHQIVYDKLPASDYDKTDFVAIRKRIKMFCLASST